MAQIKFYRGVSENSLPGHQDGAVYIIASDSSEPVPGGGSGVFYLGDMYVDMADNKRIHIKSKEGIYAKTDTEWANSPEGDSTSVQDKIYIRITSTHQPIIAIGDGSTLVKNLTYRSLDAVYTPASSVSAVGTTSAVGTATEYARADHVHNITSATITSALGFTPPTTNTTYAAGTTAAKNIATTSSAGTTAAGTPYAAGNHVHAITAATITTALGLTPSAAAAKGVVTSVTSASEDLPTSKAVDTAINTAISAVVNQNAFSNIKVGTSTIAADSVTDTFELAAGSNISLTTDTTNDKITVSATDTKYTAASSVSAVGTTSSVGTSTAYARADHIHNITSATITSALGFTPANANDLPSGSMVFKGVTTAYVYDGAATKPTDIYTGDSTPKAGDVIAYNSKEFVWGGASPHGIEFGDFSDLQNSLGNLAYANTATSEYTPSGTLTITLPTASKNVVSSVSTGTFVASVVTAAQTMVTGVTTASQTVATGGTNTNITVTGEKLVIPSAVLTSLTTTSINKITAVSTASKNVVSSVSTGTVVTAVTTASQTIVTGQPTTKTFTGTTTTITVEPGNMPV